MDIAEALKPFGSYDLWLIVIGIATLCTAVLPRLISEYPFSMPIVLLLLGYAVVALPFGLEGPDPIQQGVMAEHLTELGVIIALMGAGLNIDRKPSLKGWAVTWRLLGITMILSIAGAALVGWWVAAFAPATAMLLGAVIAPTDPVLASEVQVGAPGEGAENRETEDTYKTGHGEEDEVRFSLTSEAGLNDGLAFPFTNMAIAMAMAGAAPSNWFQTWLLIDVLYKLAIGALVGLGLGYALAHLILAMPAKTSLAKSMVGLGALAATLLIYGVTQYIDGYGFIAVFIGALIIRNTEPNHEYHHSLHALTEKTERLLTALILIALGAAIANGLLEPLTWQLVVCAIVIILLIRPFAGIIGLLGYKRAPWRERLAISFFGIRGIGSLYYLSFALNEEDFSNKEEIWALVGLVVVISIVVHGTSAAPVTSKLDEWREKENNKSASAA